MFSNALRAFVFAAACFAIAAAPQSADAASRELVSFRLMKWKSVHFDDIKKAAAHHAVVSKLGCEAKQHAHGDHYDVTYRCTKWRAMELKSHDEAHKWEAWLKAAGFETKHEH